MKKIVFFIAIACLAMAMGCNWNGDTGNTGATTLYTDDYQQTVAVPVSPTRIVSTSPAVTEIIYALGAEKLLVGRTDFCVYPPEAESIESIGGISNLNVEKIVSLKPDLVISGSMIPRKGSLQLEKMGVPIVCVIEKQNFEGLYENISKIGQLVGREQAADSLNRQLRKQAAEVAEEMRLKNQQAEPKSVYYVVGFGPSGNFTAGGNSFINDIISIAGGRNVAADITGWIYSLEALMQADPDYIMIRREDSATFCTTPPYNRLTAIKKNHIIAIESGTIDLQVPRNIDAIRFISQQLSR
jgi:iron complex transport system substrate-binding protein